MLHGLLRFVNGKNSVRGATLLLVVTLTLSNVLGLFRDRFLAGLIPADQLDAYYAAFRLPDLVTNLIVVGAIAVAFIPIFTELKQKSLTTAFAAANAIMGALTLLLILVCGLLWIFMPELMRFVVPDFDPAKFDLTVRLARWLSLTPIIFGLSYMVSGIVNSFHRFAAYAFAPVVYNLSIIVATLTLGQRWGVEGVVIGVLVGAVLHFLVQVPTASKLGWRRRLDLSFKDPVIGRMVRLMAPRMIGLGAMQLVTIVVTAIASAWSGAITYYNLASNIATVPTVIFGNSLTTAIYPTLAQAVAKQDWVVFQHRLEIGLRWIFFFLIPASVGLIILRIQIVRLVLGTGLFGWEATQTTADVLGWLAFSLVGVGLVTILSRAFYAQQDMQTPMMIALVSALASIGLSVTLPMLLPETVRINDHLLLHVGEVAALAIAFSIGMILNGLLLWIAIQRRFKLALSQLPQDIGKIILATFAMAVAVQLVKVAIGNYLDLSLFLHIFIQTAAAIIIGGLIYLLVTSWLGFRTWHELGNLLKKKPSSATSTTLE